MKFICNMWDRIDTQSTVDVEDGDEAPDVYCHRYVKSEPGSVSFVCTRETGIDKSEQIWRVECILPGVYLTNKITDAEVRKELSVSNDQS